jgi:dTDP-4-dehydrorhamnose reductase
VYTSTDALFGNDQRCHVEDDPVAPTSVYARSKLEGERLALAETDGDALIVRTCIFGWNAEPKYSLAEWVIHELRAGRTISGFYDVFFTPLLCNTLAHALGSLIERRAHGVVHVGSADVISKYEFARALARSFGLAEELVRSESIAASALAASRPRYPCLDSTRYETLTGERLPRIADDIESFRQLDAAGYPERLRALVARPALQHSSQSCSDPKPGVRQERP